jgi:trimeric autotransporter adhesin
MSGLGGVVMKHRLCIARSSTQLSAWASLALAAAITVVACGGDTPSKPSATVLSVEVAGQETFTAIGQTIQFTASASMSDGAKQDVTRTATWASTNASVISVSGTGLATAVAGGAADISATYMAAAGKLRAYVSPSSCTFTVLPSIVNVPANGGGAIVIVQASESYCRWTYASNAEWVKAGPDSDGTSTPGTGTGSIELQVGVNAGTQARQGTVTVAGLQVLVTQGGTAPTPGCTYAVSPASASFPSAGGTGSFTVVAPAGCTWYADTTSTSEDFVRISPPRDGNGNGTVRYSVASNSATTSRSGEVAVWGDFSRQRFAHRVQQIGR